MVALVGSSMGNVSNNNTFSPKRLADGSFDKMLNSAKDVFTPQNGNLPSQPIASSETPKSQIRSENYKNTEGQNTTNNSKDTTSESNENTPSPITDNTATHNEAPNNQSTIANLLETMVEEENCAEVVVWADSIEESEENDQTEEQVTEPMATFIAPQVSMDKETITAQDNPDLLARVTEDEHQSPEQQNEDVQVAEGIESKAGKFEIASDEFEAVKPEILREDLTIKDNKAPQDTAINTNNMAATKFTKDNEAKPENKISDMIESVKVQHQAQQITALPNTDSSQHFDLTQGQSLAQEHDVEIKAETPEVPFAGIETAENNIISNASYTMSDRIQPLEVGAADTEGVRDTYNIKGRALDAIKILHNNPHNPLAKTVTITLNPAHLGHMTVTLELDNVNQTSKINFTITNRHTYDMMVSTQEALKQELESVVNISESSLHFNLQEGNGEENQPQKNLGQALELKDFGNEEETSTPIKPASTYSGTNMGDETAGVNHLI